LTTYFRVNASHSWINIGFAQSLLRAGRIQLRERCAGSQRDWRIGTLSLLQ
jgi:hypothetical protein